MTLLKGRLLLLTEPMWVDKGTVVYPYPCSLSWVFYAWDVIVGDPVNRRQARWKQVMEDVDRYVNKVNPNIAQAAPTRPTKA